jgi:ABC-type multidrug transport system permease subunit
MGTYWGRLLNFQYLFRLMVARGFRDSSGLLGSSSWGEIPLAAAWGVMIFVCLLSLLVLNVRLRARETVRG